MTAKLCCRFLVLTAARSGEARGATWDEIDVEDRVWRIPSERMKAGEERWVPQSAQALDVLGEASDLRDESGLVFPSPMKRKSAMSGHDVDEGAAVDRPRGPRHRPRVPQQLQEPDARADGHALGGFGGCARTHTGQLYRASLSQVRSVRAPPRADAAVGRLRYRPASGSAGAEVPCRGLQSCDQRLGLAGRAEFALCYGPGLHPGRDVALTPPDGGRADPHGSRKVSVLHQAVDRRAAQPRDPLYLLPPQESVTHFLQLFACFGTP